MEAEVDHNNQEFYAASSPFVQHDSSIASSPKKGAKSNRHGRRGMAKSIPAAYDQLAFTQSLYPTQKKRAGHGQPYNRKHAGKSIETKYARKVNQQVKTTYPVYEKPGRKRSNEKKRIQIIASKCS
jgi:hypothetical protein